MDGAWVPVGLDQPPLHDACVLAACGDQVAVVTQEPHIGHVAAVAAVHMAGCPELGARVGKEVHFAKVIAGCQKPLLMGPAGGIDVAPIRAFGPHSENTEAQCAGV